MGETFPRTWTKPNFKGPRVTEKVRRATKRGVRDNNERTHKTTVRRRDNAMRKGCSFPLCGCHKSRLAKHVAHLQHKSMGGNPKEDRSLPAHMIQVCIARHRENAISIDRGTLQCRPLIKAAGTEGPVAWWVSVGDLPDHVDFDMRTVVDGWLELAREINPGEFEPFTLTQFKALAALAEMKF